MRPCELRPDAYSLIWVECSVITRLFALGALLYVLFVRMCPAAEAAEPE